MHRLVGSRDDLSELLSPEEAELFSLWDANRVVLRDKLILVASCRKKFPLKFNDLLQGKKGFRHEDRSRSQQDCHLGSGGNAEK